MKILVTGGAGFIGSHVADAFLALGHEVVVIDDLSSGRRENVPSAARFVQLDIRDQAAVERLLAETQFDAISHQAAQTSVAVSTREPVRDAQINVLGTIHLLEAAVKTGVRHVVFASTGGAIYGEVPEPDKATLDTPQRPLSPYACSKLACEAYLRRYAHDYPLKTTVLRYANVYGPRQDPHGEAGVVAIFTQRLMANEPIRVNARKAEGDAGCVRDYVFVGDVVKANVRALTGEITLPVVHCASGIETTTRVLAERIEAALVSSGLEVKATIGVAPRREGDVERSVLEPTFEATGAAPTALEAGLAATVEWFRERANR
ncbi:MAG: SDR family NAD(P)-dependent oxidoreductase [Deltaproteobacteria bacterium]|nr:SDR family NAD(P)-dependent oxidoreductase [Deltaproteobacteria bacterium]